MNQKRFFAFGCSFTQYSWITWADIISLKLSNEGYECYNFGNSGTGNQAIHSSLVTANSIYNFTDDDIIMVMWSSWNREDRYTTRKEYVNQFFGAIPNGLTGTWVKDGNILSGGEFYDVEFIGKYWSLDNDAIKNITAIESSRKMFNITFEGDIGSCFENKNGEAREGVTLSDEDRLFTQFSNLYMPNPMNLQGSGVKLSAHADKALFEQDGHGLPSMHLDYIRTVIQPLVDIELTDADTDEWVARYWAKAKGFIRAELLILPELEDRKKAMGLAKSKIAAFTIDSVKLKRKGLIALWHKYTVFDMLTKFSEQNKS